MKSPEGIEERVKKMMIVIIIIIIVIVTKQTGRCMYICTHIYTGKHTL